MRSHTGLDPMDHLGANRGAVDVCADVESDEGGYDMDVKAWRMVSTIVFSTSVKKGREFTHR